VVTEAGGVREQDLEGLVRQAAEAQQAGDTAHAAALLRRAVDAAPEDAALWRDLGLALVDDGDVTGAERALREALRRDGDDVGVRVHLGHLAFLRGDVAEATALLSEAVRLSPDDPAPARSLVEMHRMAGQHRAALEAAQALAERLPDDALAQVDLAELHLLLGDFDEALAAFRRLREVDGEAGHATYALHGMVEVELRRERWRRALDLAIAATAADRDPLTTELLAFTTAQLFGTGDRPAPARAELEERLAQRRAEHRRLHAETLV
jgi:Flp pilus assembly protein TadD